MRLGIIDARLGLGGVEFIHFIQCPLRIPKLPRRRPEDVDGDGGEAVAEWLGLWAGVQDHAAGEACADFVAESADRAGVSTTEGCRRLDFDRGNEAVCGFQYEVYFGAVSIAVVEQSRCLLRPSELSPEFCDHESFDDGSGRVGVGMWTGSGRRDIDEASGQSGVEKEDFRSIDDPLGKVGRPRGYAVDEIQGLEEVEVRRQVRTGISASVARELRLSSDALRAARSRMRRGRSAMRWRLETSAASRLTTRSTFLAFADSRQSRRRYAALSSPIRGYLLTDSRYLAEPVVSQQGRRGRPTPPKEPPPPARLAERVVYVSNICHMATARRRLSPQDRRAELLALGAEVFGKRPYDEVRIDEIAERAGVSRALMYHYFPDKRAFFAAVVKDEADRLYAATNKAPAPGMTMFEEIRTGVLAYMAYHQQNPEAAWAAYVGLGRSDPVLLGIDDEAKNRQMEHIMSRIAEVVSGIDRDNTLDPEVERDLRVIIHGWLAFTFELCRQRIMDPSTDAERLADACAHALLDAISRLPQIPAELADAMATARM